MNPNTTMDSNGLIPVEPDYKRKPNFTDMEKLYLLQQYATNKIILSSKLCDGATTRQKQDTWHQIALGLNHQNPTVERTAKEVKKKWENLATLARKEIAEFRSGAGRSLLRPPSALTLKILELIDDISYNPPSCDESGMAVVKEEIWDDDTGSAEMSPSTTTCTNNNNMDDSTFMTLAEVASSSSFNQQPSFFSKEISPTTPTTSINDMLQFEPSAPLPIQTPSSRAPPPFVASTYTLKRPRSPSTTTHDEQHLISSSTSNNEMTSLKKRKLYLESEKLELENEKLRIELEILRFKLNSLKKDVSSTTIAEDGDI